MNVVIPSDWGKDFVYRISDFSTHSSGDLLSAKHPPYLSAEVLAALNLPCEDHQTILRSIIRTLFPKPPQCYLVCRSHKTVRSSLRPYFIDFLKTGLGDGFSDGKCDDVWVFRGMVY